MLDRNGSSAARGRSLPVERGDVAAGQLQRFVGRENAGRRGRRQLADALSDRHVRHKSRIAPPDRHRQLQGQECRLR